MTQTADTKGSVLLVEMTQTAETKGSVLLIVMTQTADTKGSVQFPTMTCIVAFANLNAMTLRGAVQ